MTPQATPLSPGRPGLPDGLAAAEEIFAKALRDFIAYAKSFPDVWWTTREEIADWYLANHADHIA